MQNVEPKKKQSARNKIYTKKQGITQKSLRLSKLG